MAFKATNQLPAEAYRRVKGAAVNIRRECNVYIAYLAANDIDFGYLRDIYITLKDANAQFTALKSTPGIAAYARNQEDDQAYDVAAEFNTMQAAIGNVLTWLDNNVNTNVTAKVPADWDRNDTMISNIYTPAQTSGLRTQLNGVVATIS